MLVQVRGLGGAFAEEPAVPSAVRPVSEMIQLFALGVPMMPGSAAAIRTVWPRSKASSRI